MQITIHISRSTLYLFVILTLAFGLTSSTAIASAPPVPAPKPLLGGGPVPGGPGFVSLSGYDFQPVSAGQEFFRAGSAVCNSLNSAVLSAPVHLPQGARINKVVAYYMDNDSQANLIVYFNMVTLAYYTTYNVATINSSSTGFSSAYTFAAAPSINDSYNTVNLASNSYAVVLTLGGGATPSFVCLSGVRVDYDYSTNLPLVTH